MKKLISSLSSYIDQVGASLSPLDDRNEELQRSFNT